MMAPSVEKSGAAHITSGKPWQIRAYRPDDWPALCLIHDAARLFELRASVGEEAFLSLAETAENEGLFAAALDVLIEDDEVVGFVAFSTDELTWLYVHPDHFGRGHGRHLLRHAVKAAGPVFRTEVLEGNKAALGLYLSEGFVIIERTSGKLAGNEGFAAVGLCLERRKAGQD
jgi:ribosomal protein S18 acetylase RimI-like enzyme